MAPFGILNVNKPSGPTSRDVVNLAERLVRPLKAGHAGTLDPLASGVLVICVGQATRLIQYIQRLPKTYRGTFLLGCRSETDDVEGQVEKVLGSRQPTGAEIEAALPKFLGEIQQVPPAHSAINIAGRRAYQLARKGKVVELTARPVTIHRLSVASYTYPELELEIECGSGTYVRALGRDLAAVLGTTAVMSALVRTAIGRFRVENAIAPDEFSAETLVCRMQPALDAVPDLPRVELGPAELIEIRHGRPIALFANVGSKPRNDAREWAAIDVAGQLVAILRERRAGQLWPVCNLS
jgi:tRNA pseudouridine55 synthase